MGKSMAHTGKYVNIDIDSRKSAPGVDAVSLVEAAAPPRRPQGHFLPTAGNYDHAVIRIGHRRYHIIVGQFSPLLARSPFDPFQALVFTSGQECV